MSEQIEGRNAVLEDRSGKCVDKLFILDGCQDSPGKNNSRERHERQTPLLTM